MICREELESGPLQHQVFKCKIRFWQYAAWHSLILNELLLSRISCVHNYVDIFTMTLVFVSWEPCTPTVFFPNSLVHMQPVMSHVCQTNIWWCNFKHKTRWPIENPNIKRVIIQWWKSFWTPHAIVIYWSPQVHFILVQPATLTHMLHIKCSIQLKTGCFSQTTSLWTHPECKNYKCTRI